MDRIDHHAPAHGGGQLLQVEHIVKHFRLPAERPLGKARTLRAVDDVSFELGEAETLAVVGESGSGKSTLGRLIVGLLTPTSGRIVFDGKEITGRVQRSRRRLGSGIQAVFQNPYLSLNPRMTVEDVIAEPLRAHGRYDRRTGPATVRELMARVGIPAEQGRRMSREFSGGQCQRIAVARALALQPRLIILDEPVSSLDVSVQAQVLNLLADLQDEFRVAYLLVSHDLGVVRHVAHRVAVMHLGKIVEAGETETVYRTPLHPYTGALISAIPGTGLAGGRHRVVLHGEVPSPAAPPSGCRFRTRCWKAQPDCAEDEPPLDAGDGVGHTAACWHRLCVGEIELRPAR